MIKESGIDFWNSWNTSILPTAISSAAKQNDCLHELYLAQGMAKNLLFNFILLSNF